MKFGIIKLSIGKCSTAYSSSTKKRKCIYGRWPFQHNSMYVCMYPMLWFGNESTSPCEVLLRFSINKLMVAMDLLDITGGRRVHAKVQDKEEAKAISTDATLQGKEWVMCSVYHWETWLRKQMLNYSWNWWESCRSIQGLEYSHTTSLLAPEPGRVERSEAPIVSMFWF